MEELNLTYETKCKRCGQIMFNTWSREDANIFNKTKPIDIVNTILENSFTVFIENHKNSVLGRHCRKCDRKTLHEIVSIN